MMPAECCCNATGNSRMDRGHRPTSRKRARMEDDSLSDNQWAKQLFGFPQSNGIKDYLKEVLDRVSKSKRRTVNLKKPAGSTWRIGDVDDTIYREDVDEVDDWGKVYLPNVVSMQVVGVVEGTSCPCDQLVLMTCEDRKVYAYDGEDLHVAASSFKQLLDEGIEYPASKIYYDGEAFKDMTEENWAKVKEGPVGKRLDQEHHQLVTANKSRFLENLRSIRPCTGVIC
ncbi:uncharacterized protein [Pempheris klunzingeri]|uniref:uncharacterized protein n=1 Tax=Pempheris klunzingeri TaxID=3127111 RepID=UPI00397E92D7